MEPKKIAFFIIAVLSTLLGLTFTSKDYMVPITNIEGLDEGDGIEGLEEIKQGIPFFYGHLKYPTFKVLTEIKQKVTNDKAEEILSKEAISEPEKDSVTIHANLEENYKIISNIEGKIYYPGNPQEFVSKLHQKLRQKSCRIIHFGASKIEGDRITSYLRDNLQAHYGGSGPGYFPIKMPYPQKSIELQTNGNWYRYALFNSEHRKTKHLLPTNQYGLYANVCRFTSVKEKDTIKIKNASFTIKPSYKFFPRLQQYSIMGLHYGNCIAPTAISVYENGILIRKDSLITDGKYHNYKINFDKTPREIRVELSGHTSPDFYGITLDSKSGVQVDNVPTRGDSGLHFTKLKNTFDEMSRELRPDVFLFEFGGNLIPSLQTQEQVRKNVTRIISNIEWVRKRNPDALFFLIGPSDMLRRDTQISYNIIPTLVAEMKKQALENNIAFWSMYEAMGGSNSMKVWHDKGYGAHDFVHFTSTGTDKISQLLYKEFEENLISIRKIDSIQALNNSLIQKVDSIQQQ